MKLQARRLAVWVAACAGLVQAASAAEPTAIFLFIGSYHMNNAGRDAHNTKADDVLSPKRQADIAEVAGLIARYRPTKVMVEEDTERQAATDDSFAASCHGTRALTRNETEQLGFRVACAAGLGGVIAVDEDGLPPAKDPDSIDFVKGAERHHQQRQFAELMATGKADGDSDQAVLDHGSVLDMLKHLNAAKWSQANARAYHTIGLIGTHDDPVGARWVETWFGRNLAIFNNIVRHTEPGDRVLVVYGAGHGNHLHQLASDSGMYRVEQPIDWLAGTGRAATPDGGEGR